MLELQNITLSKRIEDVSLTLCKGECWHLLGKNGAGKSSLLGLMAGLLEPDKGKVSYQSQALSDLSVAQYAQVRCYLQQLPQSEFDISIEQLFAFYTPGQNIPDEIEHAFCLQPLMTKSLRHLSGGQQQRFHLARCLMQVWPSIVQGNAIILLDEPCQHLDIQYQANLLELLKYCCTLNNIVVMSSHDVNQSSRYTSHVAWIKAQRIIEHGEASTCFTLTNMQHTFDYRFSVIADGTSKQQVYVAG
ncbi:MAG: ABC transporter ATP-binding protein [Glaciecola sp.]